MRTTLAGPMPSARRSAVAHPLSWYFAIVFAAMWLHAVPEVAAAAGWLDSPAPRGIGAALRLVGLLGGPIGAAALVTWMAGGKPGLRTWLASIVRWRAKASVYLVALLGYPILAFLSVLAAAALRGHPEGMAQSFHGRLDQMAAGLGMSGSSMAVLIPLLVVYGLVVVPLFEEPGWRGFALPRLQERHGPVTSATVLGLVWAVWHLPAFFVPGSPHYGMPFIGFVLGVVAASIVLTWLYNASNGSVLVAMLGHGSIIVGSIFFPAGIPAATGDYVAYWISTLAGLCAATAVVGLAPRLGRRA